MWFLMMATLIAFRLKETPLLTAESWLGFSRLEARPSIRRHNQDHRLGSTEAGFQGFNLVINTKA
jgi:hypothetical protein